MQSLGVTPKSDGHSRRELEPATACIAYPTPPLEATRAFASMAPATYRAARRWHLCDSCCGRSCRRGTTLETSARRVSFELLLEDFNAMAKHLYATGSSSPWGGRLVWLAAVFIGSFGASVLGRGSRGFVAGLVAGVVLMLVPLIRLQRRLRPRPGGAVLCHYDVQLTPEGVHLQTQHWTADVPWHGIVAVEETAAHCFLRIDTCSAHTIPKRSFPDGEAMRQFIDFARECTARAQVA